MTCRGSVGERSCAVLQHFTHPHGNTFMRAACLQGGEEIRPMQTVVQKNVLHSLPESVCPQTPALLPLTCFLFGHEGHETTYFTSYFIAFVSDIFSVW